MVNWRYPIDFIRKRFALKQDKGSSVKPGVDCDQVRYWLDKMDSTDLNEIDRAWTELCLLGKETLPFIVQYFPKMKKWQGRTAIIFNLLGVAQKSEHIYQLGLLALNDRSTRVRYRACMLLACVQRRDAIPHLKKLLTHKDKKTAEDARAAIDAIENKNQHFFIDRHHTGQVFLMPTTVSS